MTVMIQKRTMTLGSAQPFQFEMVMNRRHAEYALAGQLERRHLDHHRQRLDDEDTTHDREHDFLANDDGYDTESRTECQCTDIAHEHLRRIGVEPEKAEPGAGKCGAENEDFPGTGNVGNAEVVRRS